jgi:DNA-binding LytR/AlgR family response regulator
MPFVRIGRSVIVNLRHIVHINVLKQELVICDMRTTCVLKVEVQKEALKKLKELFNQKESK